MARVTLEMIEHVRAVLDDYREGLYILSLNRTLPKDIQKLIWKRAAGHLEELLHRLKQKFVYDAKKTGAWLNFYVALAQAERDDPPLHRDTCNYAVKALVDRARARGIPLHVLPKNLGHVLYIAKRLRLVRDEYTGERTGDDSAAAVVLDVTTEDFL
jgi:hypothetical protein